MVSHWQWTHTHTHTAQLYVTVMESFQTFIPSLLQGCGSFTNNSLGKLNVYAQKIIDVRYVWSTVFMFQKLLEDLKFLTWESRESQATYSV